MKKMISYIAAFAILTTVPAASVYAAETSAVSVTSEAAENIADISVLVGQWKYQTTSDMMNVTAGVTDNGMIDVKEDGTYTYTEINGNVHHGKVKVEYEEYSNGDKVPFYVFYEGDKIFIGCSINKNNPDIFIIGNGGMEQLLSVNADTSAIAGTWTSDSDNRVFKINYDGTYTVLYPNDTATYGHIRIGNEMFSDNTEDKFYNFYKEGGIAWIGFRIPDTEETIDVLSVNGFTIRRVPDNTAFFSADENDVTHGSVASLRGTWIDVQDPASMITVNESSDICNATFDYTDGKAPVTVKGYIALEYSLTQSGDREYWYNFYDINGGFWNGFLVTDDVPLNDIWSGQDGAKHFVRQESFDEKMADKNMIAEARMYDFNTIMAVLNSSPMYAYDDGVIEDYAKVTDSRFTSIAGFKSFIEDTFTEELRDYYFGECDDCLLEKNGSLYVKKAYRSFFTFETDYGVHIFDPAMNNFAAVTTGDNQLFGSGKAVFRYCDGRWKISSFEYGEWRDIMAVEEYDFSNISGLWYEDAEISSVLDIRTDGTFSYTYDGGTEFGRLQPVYWFNEEGGKIVGIELVKGREFRSIAGFKAPAENSGNDIYLEQEGSSVHYVRHAEPGRYTVEQLSDMAAKDYEDRTGIRPANTHPMINSDDSVTVAMYDENKMPIDAYILDPNTGIGKLFSDKSVVKLPQTGNNSLAAAGTVAAAMALTLAGAFVVIKSGKLRRKRS